MSSTFEASRILRAGGVGRGVEQLAEGQHLAEDAGGLGQRQRRRGQELALRGGEALVHAVAELVRERHHVALLAEVVEEHVGVHLGDRRMGEGAGRLAGLDRRVDPALVEERLGELGHARVEAGIGVEHGRARLGPADLAVVLLAAAARCGPRPRACRDRATAPSAHSSGARAAGRRRRPRRAAPGPPRARRRWRGGARSAASAACASGPRSPCPWRACW